MLAEGSCNELQTSGLDFAKFLGSSSPGTIETETANDDPALLPVGEVKTEEPTTNGDDNTLKKPRKPLSGSISSDVIASSSSVEDETDDGKKTEPVVAAETCSTGNVALNVYVSYIFSGGRYFKVLALLLVCVLTQLLASGADIWIRVW